MCSTGIYGIVLNLLVISVLWYLMSIFSSSKYYLILSLTRFEKFWSKVWSKFRTSNYILYFRWKSGVWEVITTIWKVIKNIGSLFLKIGVEHWTILEIWRSIPVRKNFRYFSKWYSKDTVILMKLIMMTIKI